MENQGYRERLLAAPMSRFQIMAVTLVIALCALDGFDVFAITFVIPQLEKEWGVGKAELGLVLSAGLFGMAAGSLLIAPLADIWGRRRVLLPSLALVTAGTAWSAAASGPLDLGLSRLATGIGIGAMIAIINPLAAEYSNARRRDLCVTLLNLGFPVGAIIGGMIAAWILPQFGWRMLFVCAAGLGVVMIALAARWLPEPVASLIARPSPSTLDRVNLYLRLCNQPELSALPAAAAKKDRPSALSLLARRDMAVLTLRVMAVYFLYVVSLFYIQSWIPAMVVGAGFTPSQAAHVSVWMNGGGIAGGLLLGLVASRIGLRQCVALAFAAGAATIAAFGLATIGIVALSAMAALLGCFTIGGMAGLYAVVSRSFPAEARASGTGLVIGVGRLGSAIAPATGGLLFSLGFGQLFVSALMAIPAVIAALLVLRLPLRWD
ncbi:MFS transporter [Sphingobium jiangsuense]|uniref:Benzoate transport n=1 Tax=Sphingobium jiangsuense TaxID=870476 RepID=A0A7W6BJM2_9SPHN|nr:MFS transporter [Sphingobium jiangsuense]MBB3928261.1 benzoate transport [Sphingobium jiangsuense]GLS99363.1 MFS transporter [Sphingobium jiangsuense]